MYALLFLLMAFSVVAAIKKWRLTSLFTFGITLMFMVMIFITHIRHINISL